jgi:hypothetical protein
MAYPCPSQKGLVDKLIRRSAASSGPRKGFRRVVAIPNKPSTIIIMPAGSGTALAPNGASGCTVRQLSARTLRSAAFTPEPVKFPLLHSLLSDCQAIPTSFKSAALTLRSRFASPSKYGALRPFVVAASASQESRSASSTRLSLVRSKATLLVRLPTSQIGRAHV